MSTDTASGILTVVPQDSGPDSRTIAKAGGREVGRVAAPGLAPISRNEGRDSYAVTAIADITDRSLHAAMARVTAGLSPAALAHAYWDWAAHLAFAPGKRLQLVDKAFRKAVRLATYTCRCAACGAASEPCIEPLPQDRRFAGKEWQEWPYSFLYQAFLLNQQWWHNATTGVRGVSKQHEDMVEFMSRQVLDIFSPSNFPLTNPEVLGRTVEKGGANLVSGLQNLAEDWERAVSGKRPVGTDKFAVGRNVANHARQGGLPQSIDRADPVSAGDRYGATGADPHRAGLDHEVLRSRPVAAELPGEISGRTRLHGVHAVLEEPGSGRPRSRH
jgi:hypothetical protein